MAPRLDPRPFTRHQPINQDTTTMTRRQRQLYADAQFACYGYAPRQAPPNLSPEDTDIWLKGWDDQDNAIRTHPSQPSKTLPRGHRHTPERLG